VGKKAHALASLPTFDGKSTSLALTDGFSLGYAFRVPEGARLQGTLSPGQGSLRIRAVRDDLSVSELGSIAAGGPVDVDLGALSGQIVRLDLTAAGDVALEAPRVTIAERAPVVPLKPVRNVLVYLIDTLRADHLKPFNPKTRVKTPGLDELVEKGTAVFTSAHTQENWTKPSVATLLSSLLPWQHEAVTTEAVVPKSVRMLPEMLADLGFHSGAFIANGYVSDKFGFNQGWDTYRNYIREGRPTRAKFLASDVLEWLDKRPKTQPFFLYVHAIDPHVPYRPTTEFISIYDPEPYSGVVDFSGNSTLLEDIKIGKIKLKDRDKVRLEALYDSEISYHDVHFRSIMNALQTRGVADDTLVVLVADHGEEFWDHGSVGHGHSVYEELIRIPMLIRMPGVTREPVWLDNPAGLVDVVPTVFEALGEKVPEGLSGRSLLPLLRGDTDTAPRITVSGFMDGWRTAVVSGVKLIQRTEKRVMLHDLATDPREQTDVAHERPISVRYLRGQLGLALWASEQAGSSVTGPSRRHRAEKTTIDAATAAQLEALGYVGTSRP
jgi:arylsulfatase A-like enzyme